MWWGCNLEGQWESKVEPSRRQEMRMQKKKKKEEEEAKQTGVERVWAA